MQLATKISSDNNIRTCDYSSSGLKVSDN